MMVSVPPLLRAPSGAEEALGRVQRRRVHAAGEGAAARRQRQVVGAHKARQAVEEDDDVLAVLGEALGALQRQLGDAAVVLDGIVERGGEDLAADGAAHVGDLLRALAREDHHDVDVVVVGGEAAGDELQQEGLARLGRRDDEGPLPPADGRHQVDEALGQVLGRGLQPQVLAGVDRDEAVEVGARARLLRLHAVDRLHADQAEVALAILRRPHLAGDGVAGAQHEAPDLGLRDVHVAGAGPQAVLSQEAVAVAHDLQQAGGQHEALALGHGLQDAQGQLLPAEGAVLQAQPRGPGLPALPWSWRQAVPG